MSRELPPLKKGDAIRIDWSDIAAERGDKNGDGGIVFGSVIAVVPPNTSAKDCIPKGYSRPYTVNSRSISKQETYIVAANGSRRSNWPARRRLTKIT